MNIRELNEELSRLQDIALQMVASRETNSAHNIHKRIQRIKQLIKQETNKC